MMGGPFSSRRSRSPDEVGVTTLFLRTGRTHYLSLLLSAILAWPASLPVVDGVRSGSASIAVPASSGTSGPSFRKSERKSRCYPAEWSVDADNVEGSDGRDDLRYIPLAIPHQRFDLPSLIPAPLESRPAPPFDSPATSPEARPLRC